MTPIADFRITLDGEDLSPKIRPRLISLRITEKRGGDADQLDLVLDDSDGRLALPPEGAVLTVELGWKAGDGVAIGLVDKGRFKVDEVEHSGPPDTVSIRASAADFASALTTRREQSWHSTTLGAIVDTVAGRHKLKPRCAPALASIAVHAKAQERESDIALLRRLGREHDAVATIKAGCLIFAPIGAGITATGQPLPGVTIRRRDGDRHSYRVEKREAAGKVVAEWHDRKAAKKKKVTAGSGDGTERKLSRVYASEGEAKRAAAAETKRAGRAPRSLDLTLALGRAELAPEQPATAEGFKADIDAQRWLISEVNHQLDARGGFTTAVNLEIRA
ncbi:contractile injection system protein, VgrG/Pvc8 family [Sphingomonas pituitosa]|uniref:contractile injection system protein, VgrG/Pvc8 family n=1 Tax=Sphingomonas pituitosa TaxID=99597 RepID=UPI00082E1396|nr:contractile injection system protein, VgrG/Pvc8 family [Sphingomonas pituitosa]